MSDYFSPRRFLGDVIGFIIGCAIAHSFMTLLQDIALANNEYYKDNLHKIYPKWISFKIQIKYRIRLYRYYRHIRQENKRFHFGVLIRND